jgi:hypothetical protein
VTVNVLDVLEAKFFVKDSSVNSTFEYAALELVDLDDMHDLADLI